ncbi:lysophospholipid acyltransferase family protein [Cetobacterium sp. ZWU0022]|uniref:lysophospholipid acyltransferase family protein n=1 Tax=Cetobacterium sp. ZWU0022 TaxID=1340502 RepID=UPI000645BF8B|nr:lysophospholipid acyltransferase family protein [Cetobacterium sp. ZWU0022]
MLTLIKVTFVALLNFAYITIFKAGKIKKMSSEKAPLEARKVLREQLCMSLIKAAKIDLEVTYLDEKAYRKLKREDGVVVVANHESNLDIPVLVTALDLPLGFVAKKEMESWPFYSMWMKMSKCIFLDRSNPREGIKSIKKAVDIVKQGYPTVIFPEGERTLTGKMGTFKKGSFKLATETNGIILPVTIDGTFFVQSRKSIKINPNKKVRVTVGKPIDLKKMYLENGKNISEIVQELVGNEKIVKNN